MILAQLIAADEDALVCDFAETYHVFDIYALPVKLAATLAAGLPNNARSILKVGGASASPLMIILAHILDELRFLHWAKTIDGQKGRNRPQSVAEQMTGRQKKSDVKGFATAEDFEKERERLLRAYHGN